tara:strand:+ start:16193 stop:16531 length:339 start_codon:yes stop_codon:yes gene_type:complete
VCSAAVPTVPATSDTDVACFDYDGLRRLETAFTSTEWGTTPPSATGVGGVAPYWIDYASDILGNRTEQTRYDGVDTTVTEFTHGAGGAGPHQLTDLTGSSASPGTHAERRTR